MSISKIADIKNLKWPMLVKVADTLTFLLRSMTSLTQYRPICPSANQFALKVGQLSPNIERFSTYVGYFGPNIGHVSPINVCFDPTSVTFKIASATFRLFSLIIERN